MPSLDIKKTISDVRAGAGEPTYGLQRCKVCGQTFNTQNLPEAEHHQSQKHEPRRSQDTPPAA